jgi:hypothetical protein
MPAKRPPKDVNELAKYILASTGETEKIQPPKKNPHAQALSKLGASKGGKERANLEGRSKWIVALVILVILIILVGWGSLWYEKRTENRAREVVLNALNDLSPNASVTIDGEPTQQAPVLEALKRLQHEEAHHSYPLKPIQVEIRDGSKTIKLVVAQDSERPHEYWVFRPGPNYHNDPLGEFLGGIETRTFQQ